MGDKWSHHGRYREFWKFDILDKLNRWGINSTTLGIEDSYVDTIAADIADKILGKNN